MCLDEKAVRLAIEQSLSQATDLDDETVRDISFHMTDWLSGSGGLEEYYRFCRNPGQFEPDDIQQLLMGFLIHVPDHVAAAAKLLADQPVSDIFEVGAVDMTQEEKVKQFALQLEVHGQETVRFPSDLEIERGLKSLDGVENCIAIIGPEHGLTYLRLCLSEDPEECEFEYVELEERYACEDPRPPLDLAVLTFQQYAHGDDEWKRRFVWEEKAG